MAQHTDDHLRLTDFQAATAAIDALLDSAVSDETLHTRARKALDVLDHEAFSSWNIPPYLEQFAYLWPPSPAFTVKRLFDSMLDVAQDLDLREGYRYTSAAICVFSDAVCPAEPSVARAQRLTQLAMLLVAHLLWPFVAYKDSPSPEKDPLAGHCLCCDCDDRPDVDLESCYPTANETERKVMMRDNYRCVATGIRWEGRETWEKDSVSLATGLRINHIFKNLTGMSGKEPFWCTLELLHRFCELPPQCYPEQTDAPDNLFLLEPATQTAWNMFRCAFVPVEPPTRYRLVNYLPYRFSGFPVAEEINFIDHRKEWVDNGTGTVPLPNAKLLRARAAITGVLNRSGILNLLETISGTVDHVPEWPCPEADGESLLRFLEGYRACAPTHELA